jgi:Ni/Co efflux regulator RcnB
MKRPVTLLLVASLLAGSSAFAAATNDKERFAKHVAEKAMRSDEAKRDMRQDRRDDRRHDRRDHRRDDRRDDRRHDWNDRRDHSRHDNDRRDHDRRDHGRYDNDRRHHDRRDWDRNRHGYHGWDRHRNDWHNHPHYWENRRHDRRDYARYRYHFGHYHAPRGYYYRTWYRGDRLPRHWYGHSYIVYDWRPYRLYAPPYGYHWVRVGNDVLLTAIATGVVLDVLYDIWY